VNRGLLILLVGFLAGAAAFFLIREQGVFTAHSDFARDGNTRLPELEWLRRKLDLTDEQFAKVVEAHEAYRPTCEALCMKVMASHAKIKKLATPSAPVSPELESALTEHAMLHVECQKAMLNHLHKTASVMSPKQAEVYLEALLPEVIELPLEPSNDPHGH
jgi:hypothetical protein